MNQLVWTRFPAFDYAYGEAINTLCTNITFCGSDKREIMITSAQAHEGKSLLSMSMQRVLAQLGRRVVLVDADLRRSQLAARYGMDIIEGSGKGLAHYLAGMCTLDEVIYRTDVENAYMIPVGQAVSNSLALLNTPRLEEMLIQLKSRFDYVLIDAPPVGAIIDAAEIGRYCDGALIVIKYNNTSRSELVEVRKQVERAGCEVLGAVLNDIELDSLSSKKYYNKNYYTQYTSDYYKPRQKKKRAAQSK